MPTMISDERPEELERDALRVAVEEKERAYLKCIAPLLEELSPKSDAHARDEVGQNIARAITTYVFELQAAPRESLRSQRKELRKARAAFEACYSAVEGGIQSSAARAAFNVAMLKTPGSRRELRKQLICALKASEMALSSLDSSPQIGDWHTAALSAELTLQMRTLGIRAVASSDMYTRLRPGKPAKSASLARLLRTAMELAGATPPDDLRYFIKKGFELARTRGVPVALKLGAGTEARVLSLEKLEP